MNRRSSLAAIAAMFPDVPMAPRKKFTETLYVRVPTGTLDRIAALQNGLPQGEYVRSVLLEALDERERAAARRKAEDALPEVTNDG